MVIFLNQGLGLEFSTIVNSGTEESPPLMIIQNGQLRMYKVIYWCGIIEREL